jgi:hypothetical protein
MGRKKKYINAAEKQAAYRERLEYRNMTGSMWDVIIDKVDGIEDNDMEHPRNSPFTDIAAEMEVFYGLEDGEYQLRVQEICLSVFSSLSNREISDILSGRTSYDRVDELAKMPPSKVDRRFIGLKDN